MPTNLNLYDTYRKAAADPLRAAAIPGTLKCMLVTATSGWVTGSLWLNHCLILARLNIMTSVVTYVDDSPDGGTQEP